MNKVNDDAASVQEIYISVDVETAGPIPGLYSMLSLGACPVDDPEDGFYVELQPITAAAIPEALQVSGFSLDVLARTGRLPADGMTEFAAWVDRQAAGGVPVFVGFNASFDWSFVNWYFYTYTGSNPFGIGGVDIKAYYMGRFGTRWVDTASSRLPARFRSDRLQTHNALDDAQAQADIFRKVQHRGVG